MVSLDSFVLNFYLSLSLFSDLTLLEYSIVKFCPSLVATAVVLQANYVVRGTGWSDTLEHYSGYSYEAGNILLERGARVHSIFLTFNL